MSDKKSSSTNKPSSTKTLEENIHLLQVLHQAHPKLRKAILENAKGSLVTCLCECAKNILNSNVPAQPHHLKQLKRYRKDVFSLVNKKVSKKKKKQLLQKGGFIKALLAPIAIALFSSLAKKIIK